MSTPTSSRRATQSSLSKSTTSVSTTPRSNVRTSSSNSGGGTGIVTTPMASSTPNNASEEEREQALRDYKVTIEYKHLKSHAPGGVYLIPSFDSLRSFYGVIFVRRGPYTNGIFKFTLQLPKRYNDINQHPIITFVSPVYNPYVNTNTGIVDMKQSYPKWDPTRHYLVTVLTFIKKIFYVKVFDQTAIANIDAKTLAEHDPILFRQHIDECVRISQKDVFNNTVPSDTLLKFTEDELGHRVLRDLLKANVKDPSTVSKNAILSMIDKASKV